MVTTRLADRNAKRLANLPFRHKELTAKKLHPNSTELPSKRLQILSNLVTEPGKCFRLWRVISFPMPSRIDFVCHGALPRFDSIRARIVRTYLRRCRSRYGDISVLHNFRSSRAIDVGILGRPSRQSVYVTVAHTENSRDQDGIVDLPIDCTFAACCINVTFGHQLTSLLNFTRDIEQGLELGRNFRVCPVGLYFLNKLFIVIQLSSCDRAMNGLAEQAIVAPGNVCGNQFALARCQGAFTTQQDIHELVDGGSSFRAIGHRSKDSGEFPTELGCKGQLNMGHETPGKQMGSTSAL